MVARVSSRLSCIDHRVTGGNSMPFVGAARFPETSNVHRKTGSRMLTAQDIEIIQARIVELQVEHRDLDLVIETLTATAGRDELRLRRLKKRKLQLKDTITLMQMRLIPDIPA